MTDLWMVSPCSSPDPARDEHSAQLEDLQEVVGEGPSYSAYDERSIQTLVVDGAPDQRWPLFSQAVKQLMDSCTLYAVPIKPGPQTMGVATFYQRHTSRFGSILRPVSC